MDSRSHEQDFSSADFQAARERVAELEQELERLRLRAMVLDQISDMVTITNLDGRVMYMNRAEARAMGVSSQEPPGRHLGLSGDDRGGEADAEEVLRLTLEHGAWRGRAAKLDALGRERDVDVRTRVITDGEGRPVAVCCVGTDMTETRKAREEAAQGGRRLEMAMRAARMACWEWDPDTDEVFYHGGQGDIYGYVPRSPRMSLEESAARIHELDRAEALLAFRRAVASLKTFFCLYRVVWPDGSPQWVRSTAEPVFDGQGGLAGYIGVSLNATSSLGPLEDLGAVFDLSPDLICIVDISTAVFIRVNPSFTRLLGYSEEELLGRSVFQLVPRMERTSTRSEMMELLDMGAAVFQMENQCLCKDGRTIWLHWIVRFVPELGRAYAIARDVTARRREEEAMRRAKDTAETASRAKNELLANMSHEIRTPLNGIMGMLQVMRSRVRGGESGELADNALDSCRRLGGLLSDMLDLARIEADKLALVSDPFELRHALSQVMKLFSHEAEAKGLRLAMDVEAGVPDALVGDSLRLEQVLVNLVGNAVKFTDQGGVCLNVRVLPASGPGRCRLLFIVADTGPGVHDDDKCLIFDSFSRAIGSTDRPIQGVGLGLAIVRRLVGLMGGSAFLDSEPGEGCAVYVSLPFESCEGSESKASAEASAEGMEGLKVLVAEDDPVNQLSMKHLLALEGCEAVVAEDGLLALEALKSGDYDLVLMDVRMPRMDGVQATRMVRTDPALAHVSATPIIALTAHAMAGDRERFLQAGMDAYVAKPVEVDELVRTVRVLLGGKD